MKTGDTVIVDEGYRNGGYKAEIVAIGKYFATIKCDDEEWDIMKKRLRPHKQIEMIPENTTSEYVVLRHLCMPDKGKCFFTTNGELGRSCHGITGDLWYEIVGYADSVREAQTLCGQNYGGLPSMKEFEDHAKETIKKRYDERYDER